MSESHSAVTYLFSDIEGSTRLWETEPQRIGPALARHDRLARDIVEQHGGRVVKMTGDGVHAAFDDAAAAVAAVLQIQLAMVDPPDSMLPLNLRCGLHLGVDQRRDGDFFGPAVNRAARVMQAAHGGQVLLSQPVAERIERRLPQDASLRDLGVVRLRDLTTPERLYQLVHAQLRADFPALRSLASTPNNLAQQLNSFIGREQEIQEVKALLKKNRLVTLLAMGGIGKSRLSVQLGAEVLDDYPDGVWLIELAPLTDPGAVAQAVAGVLGVKEEAGGSVIDALLRFVRERELLIILDNCEHLVHAAADLTKRLLQGGPQVTVLASSRDALQVAGERIFQLQPLSAPTPDDVALDRLTRHESVRLFIDRASAVQPSFHLSLQNAAAVADICHRLDGIALAIELAAARMRVLSADAIASRLNDRFRLLTTGDRTVLPRQRTLRALIDWSYDLLTAPERAAFGRLSVFAGGWTLEAAEEVAAGEEIERDDVLDLLARLVEKSLVSLDVAGDRYRMLETVREYAAEKLEAAADAAQVRSSHLTYYLTLVEQARPHLVGPEQVHWLVRLGLERQNVLAAHAWCDRAVDGVQAGLRLSSALRIYWLTQGLLDEGMRFALAALARSDPTVPDLNRGRTLYDAGHLSYESGRYGEARDLLAQSLDVFRSIGDRTRAVTVLQLLGLAWAGLGDLAAARRCGEEAVATARQQPNRYALGVALANLAQSKRAEGDLAGAAALCDEALPIFMDHGDHLAVANVQFNHAMIAVAQKDPVTALASARRASEAILGLDSPLATQSMLFVTAAVAAAHQAWEDAASLLAAADAQARARSLRRDPADHLFLTDLAAQIAAQVSAEVLTKAQAQATQLPECALADKAIQSLSRFA